jgi:hypothetical protein
LLIGHVDISRGECDENQVLFDVRSCGNV